MLTRRLSCLHSAALFCSVFYNAPKEGSGTQSLSPEEKLKKAETDLAAANLSVSSLTKERDDAKAEVLTVTGQFNTAAEEAKKAKAEVTDLTGKLDTVTKERDEAKSSLNVATGNISRLETLCGVKGIDPKSAVTTPPVDPAGPQTMTAKSFEDQLNKTTDPVERAKISKEFEKAVQEGRVTKG